MTTATRKMAGVALSAAAVLAAVGIQLDPLDMRWTFGAHEGYTMYRRVGRYCTGGIDGNAKWVKPWLDWWDENAPAAMEEMGLNWCHSRFYKGMGWNVEKRDFGNVKKFVRNCHAHGVKVLAYTQYATFYPEVMREEIPEIDSWAKVGADGGRKFYFGQYFRWEPCINCREWVEYVKKVVTVALTEGGFDGIMFDNCFSVDCYCPRCEKLFGDYLRSQPNAEERFGFPSVAGMCQPRPRPSDLAGEIQDPVVQAWLEWRCDRHAAVVQEFHDHIKSVKPDAIVSANPMPYRMSAMAAAGGKSVDHEKMKDCFDLIVMQSANFPGLTAKGEIVNRVRDLKMAQCRGKVVVALCDNDSRETAETERRFELCLLEDAVFGGVPTDRTSMNPAREPGFLPTARRAKRKPVHARLNKLIQGNRAAFAAKSYQPVKVFFPCSALKFSTRLDKSLAAAEEILLRNRVPWGYALSRADKVFKAPEDCELLILPGTIALSDKEIAGVLDYAKTGGRLVVTGEAGRYDECVAERFTSPLMTELKRLRLPNVVLREKTDELPTANLGWGGRFAAPVDGGAALMADISATGWKMPADLGNLPPSVFAEWKKSDGRLYVHLLNYHPEVPADGIVFHRLLTF